MFEWAYVGVDHSLPGNGGQECVDFIPLWQRIAESALACAFAAVCLKIAYKRVTLPEKVPQVEHKDLCGKRILLVTMCLTFGIELGFKLATRQFIWIFNPCHVTSMIQIYILAAPPGKLVTAMFRLHLHMLSGAPIAILFPVINTRLLPFETEVYFIQHILMMIIPFYLMKIGGVYTPEKLSDMSWALLSLGWLYFFHFVPLNYLAVLSHVNLNNMLCPAVSDPFYGRLYRICAMIHQALVIPMIGKFIVASSYKFKLAKSGDVKERKVFVRDSHSGVSDSQTEVNPAQEMCSHIGTDSDVHNDKTLIASNVKHRNGIVTAQETTENNRSLHSGSGDSNSIQENGHAKHM